MGAILSYSIISGIVLLFCYLPYRWFMADRKQFAFNRSMLIAIYIISLLSPFFFFSHTTAPENIPDVVTSAFPATEPPASQYLESAPENTYIFPIGKILVAAYFIGLTCVGVMYLLGVGKILWIIRKSPRIRLHGENIVISDNSNVTPFSWGNTIVVNRQLYGSEQFSMVFAHESAHVRLLHWIDLSLAQITLCIQWFNPAAWMLRDCLKEVHEFQADENVLNKGINPRAYQLFLVSAAFSEKFNIPVEYLSAGNIRKRIRMMNNRKSADIRRLALISLLLFSSVGIFSSSSSPVKLFINRINDISFSDRNVDTDDYIANVPPP